MYSNLALSRFGTCGPSFPLKRKAKINFVNGRRDQRTANLGLKFLVANFRIVRALLFVHHLSGAETLVSKEGARACSLLQISNGYSHLHMKLHTPKDFNSSIFMSCSSGGTRNKVHHCIPTQTYTAILI